MSQEETTQTAGEQADVETQEESTEEESTETEEESKESDDSQNIDYKAIAEEERKRREAADKKAADLAYKLRDKKRQSEESEESDDFEEDKPLTRSELSDVLKEFSQTNEKSQQEIQAKQLIKQYTSNEDEAEAAYEMWKSRIVPTGNLEADIMFAVGGLNHKRILANNEELKRSLKGKGTVNRDASGTHRDPSGTSEPKLSNADASALKASGMKWNNEKKVYSKKLKDGKTFYWDTKTNKRWKE